jgi:serine/threonine protein kinase
LIHRDIKPANLVLLAGTRQIKILDFGLTRARERKQQPGPFDIQTMQGVMIGTPDYVSPEQARDPRSVDIRADIYSLGCTFYYLLTGQPPFPGTSFLEKIYKHQTKEPTAVNLLRPECPAPLANTLAKMMAKQPEDRFQTPAEVAEVLVGFSPPERALSIE